jgi:hypothetical protein
VGGILRGPLGRSGIPRVEGGPPMIAAISARIVRRWAVLRVGASLVGWG